jgi:hypothetical protein
MRDNKKLFGHFLNEPVKKVHAMDQDKRKGGDAIPQNAMDMLNELQVLALRQMEGFGWRLHFIRRPLFQERIVVVIDSVGEKMGILEEDGSINMASSTTFR